MPTTAYGTVVPEPMSVKSTGFTVRYMGYFIKFAVPAKQRSNKYWDWENFMVRPDRRTGAKSTISKEVHDLTATDQQYEASNLLALLILNSIVP